MNRVAQPRGVPNDLSVTTSIDLKRWDCDAHSESWLTGQELNDLEVWQRDRAKAVRDVQLYPFGFLFGNGFDASNIEELKKSGDIEDVRAVFWFDN